MKYKIEPDQCLLILFDPKLDFLKVDQLPQCIILISERKCHTNNENIFFLEKKPILHVLPVVLLTGPQLCGDLSHFCVSGFGKSSLVDNWGRKALRPNPKLGNFNQRRKVNIPLRSQIFSFQTRALSPPWKCQIISARFVITPCWP